MAISITKFYPFQRNILIYLADILLKKKGLAIHDCHIHEKNGRQWVSVLAGPYETDDSKKSWTSISMFFKESNQAFQKLAVAALDICLNGDTR